MTMSAPKRTSSCEARQHDNREASEPRLLHLRGTLQHVEMQEKRSKTLGDKTTRTTRAKERDSKRGTSIATNHSDGTFEGFFFFRI